MSSSRTVEDTYEAQNDDRLNDLHTKLRTLRGVSTARMSPALQPTDRVTIKTGHHRHLRRCRETECQLGRHSMSFWLLYSVRGVYYPTSVTHSYRSETLYLNQHGELVKHLAWVKEG